MKNNVKKIVLAAVTAMLFAGCNVGTTDTGGNTAGDGEYAAPQTDMSKLVPHDLLVASPTATVFEGVSELDGTYNYNAKRKFLADLISAENECSFSLSDYAFSAPDCFRAPLEFNNHPNGEGLSNYSHFAGNLGIQNEADEDGEACIATTVSQMMANVAARTDNAAQIYAAMTCAGVKAGLGLPAMGQTLNYSSAMQQHASASGFEVSSAVTERLADDANGNAVYLTTIGAVIDFSKVASSMGNEVDPVQSVRITLKHTPTSSDNGTYKGKLTYLVGDPRNSETSRCTNAGNGRVFAGTLTYEKGSSTSIRYELNDGNFCGSDTNPFDANSDIDIEDGDDSSNGANPSGWADGWFYLLADVDPSTESATMAFGWQDWYVESARRAFYVDVDAQSDGSATGKAYFGYGTDWDNPAQITAFFCNWDGPKGYQTGYENVYDVEQFKAQYQEFGRAVGSTQFMPTLSNIKYAPTDDCTASAGDGFTYWAEPGIEDVDFSNDRINDGEAIVPDLLDIEDIDFVMPVQP